ncbi:MAG: nitronate monooxygenase family protein [Eubacteriales bacterium]|nr:nitronate monooxygenase family protein [Eubacteriales bacterium]
MNTNKSLHIGELTAKLPLIQGGMGVGISLGGLAGAVAREGGIGIISAAQIGYREPDFDENPLQANLRAIHKELQKAREAAEGGIIGFNIMVAMKNYEMYVREAVNAGADLIISGAGLPTELPKYTEGSNTKIAPIVSTNKSANVILKYWDKKYNRIPDLLVIEGPKAGGHLGFTREQLDGYTEETYEAEVLAILSTVKKYEEKYNVKIPTALAGAMDMAEKISHAFSIGVDAVQVATPFVTTEECDADIRYKEAYVNAEKEDIRIVKSPVGMPGRAISNEFLRRVDAGEKIPHRCHQCLHKCNPAEIPYCITDALIHAAKGEVEEALLFCGADAYQADKINTVKEVISLLFPQ